MPPGRFERAMRKRWFRRAATPTADREPPAVPDGWHIGPPDFVGVGVQRAGTTWWFAELRRHPSLTIARGSRKELHYFDAFADRPLTRADIERYHKWFPRPRGTITGEWTPSYMYQPWVPPMIAEAVPGARVIVLLRDPIDRFRSGVDFGLGRGFSLNESVLDAFHRGLYAGQIARLLAHVPRAQCLVLLYEQLRAEPATERARTAAFLGLDQDRFPNAVEPREPTASADDDGGVTGALVPELRERYRDDLVDLARLLPELDFDRWTALLKR